MSQFDARPIVEMIHQMSFTSRDFTRVTQIFN